jgi:hypothetical protein
VTAADEIVGKDGIAAQTEQVFRKLDLALTAAGATLEIVVKWTCMLLTATRSAGIRSLPEGLGRQTQPTSHHDGSGRRTGQPGLRRGAGSGGESFLGKTQDDASP